VNLAWILMPHRFGLAGADAATRLSIASVGVWWLGFSIPLFRSVPEPAVAARGARPATLALDSLREVLHTLATLPRHPELFQFLIAFWLYSDGIGTIVKMATVYGSEVGIGRNDLIGALLLVQILAAPASLAFGRLAKPLGAQRAVALGLLGYVGITMLAYFLTKPIHFWMLAALSRSMFASLVPPERMSEMFGFYSVSEKLAGIVGPLLFGVVAQISGAGRYAVLTLLPFFIVGAWLLLRVDLKRGAERARDGQASALNP
jgi:UMF1 family MFS transporter